MAQVWRWMALTSGVFQAIGGYDYVALFDATQDYTAVFLAGGAAMALGVLISLGRGKRASHSSNSRQAAGPISLLIHIKAVPVLPAYAEKSVQSAARNPHGNQAAV